MTRALRFFLNQADVIFERFDAEIVAIQLATGDYHSILGAGVDAFLMLPFEPTVAEMSEALAKKYDAGADVIAADLTRFLDGMREESLLGVRETQAVAAKPLELTHSGPRLPYEPPVIQPFRDLQELFLIDPVHDVGPQGWPQVKSNPALDQDCHYRPQSPASMIFERFDDETVAFNLGTGSYYNLTGPAEDIFLLLDQEPTSKEVVRALQTKYQASEELVPDAVLGFLRALVEAGLAEAVASSASAEDANTIRQLELNKPGQGLPFVKPALDTYHERSVPAGVLAGTQQRSSAEFTLKRFRISEPGVIFRAAGREAVLINLDKGEYYLLNPSAANAFRALQHRPTASELVDHLARAYQVDRRELKVSVMLLLANLLQEGLVSFAEAEDAGRHFEAPESFTPQPFEPFSMEAFRELRGLFLPFPGTRSEKTSPVSSRGLVSLLSDFHRHAASRAGLTEAVYHIAGQSVRVRCAGAMQIPELGLAFGHLRNGLPADSKNDFTVQVWDAVSGGNPEDAFLASYLREFYSHWDTECGPRGEVLAFHSEQLPVLYHAGPDIFKVVDVENRTAYYLKRDASPLPYWEIGSPFRAILHYWLSLRGLQFVHGGAVGNAQGGVVLVGKGGSGKSTISLACMNAGMSYAGDDYCAVKTEGDPYLHSLYSTAKLKGPQDLDRFPHLRERVWNPDCFSKNGDKATFFLSQWWPEKLIQGFPLRAILVPQVTGQRDTELAECSEAQALLALSASTVAQLPMAGAPDLGRLGDLVARLPRYMLYAGTDLTQIPRVIQSVL